MEIQIVTGFLGAGKTTFLNRYLPLLSGKTVVIENEFGDIGIDGDRIQEDIPVREIFAGCICCSLATDFRKGIKEIAENFHPDRILIEPSGVGRLTDIVKACQMAREREKVSLQITKLIAIVDMASFEEYIEGFGAFYQDQIERAGLLLLSHVEAENKAQKEIIIGRLKELNPDAILYDGDWRQLENEELLKLLEEAPDYDEDARRDAAFAALPADKVFSSVSFMDLPQMRIEDLEAIMKALEKEEYGYILRAKGWIETMEKGLVHFDFTPSVSKYREEKNPTGTGGEAVVIGCGLNQAALEMLFRRKNI